MVKVIGILGSGQLGRMIALAAAELGVRAHIFAPDADHSPAGDVAYATTTAAYDDEAALDNFAAAIDGVTSEFENVPSSALARIARQLDKVNPSIAALDTAQDRLSEKRMAQSLGIATPAFWDVTSEAELVAALAALPDEGFLKTRRDGYDGKGQMRVSNTSDSAAIWQEMGGKPLILESKIDFVAEASFLIARDAEGRVEHFPATMNHHINGILATSTAPAPLDAAILQKGYDAIENLARHLDLCGILAMESFIAADGTLIFNEIAPRPHNSFHWTIEGATISQFEQAARLAAGLPMRPAMARGAWRMENLLGQHGDQIPGFYADPVVHTHIYGKDAFREGRKIGHITYALSDSSDKSNKVS